MLLEFVNFYGRHAAVVATQLFHFLPALNEQIAENAIIFLGVVLIVPQMYFNLRRSPCLKFTDRIEFFRLGIFA